MDFLLTDQQLQLQEAARSLCQSELIKAADELESAMEPRLFLHYLET